MKRDEASLDLVEKFSVWEEFEKLITPLSQEEFNQLEQNILQEGCLTPLILWKKGDEHVLLDGHNRYRICSKHNIPFQTESKSFKSKDEAKLWMVKNQLGRRNLTPDQLSYYRGAKYLLSKQSKGGFDKVLAKGTENLTTSARLAAEYNVSESTVKRDAKFAQALNLIGAANDTLKNDILTGRTSLKKGDILQVIDPEFPGFRKLKNEKDLFNKIHSFQQASLQQIEESLDQVEQSQESDIKEPLFLSEDERINKLKGRIISAINDAIRNRNIDAIEELKGLIGKLEKLLV